MQILIIVFPNNKPINNLLVCWENANISDGIFLLYFFKFKKAVSEPEKKADKKRNKIKIVNNKYIEIMYLLAQYHYVMLCTYPLN